jgi:hypothetical protein
MELIPGESYVLDKDTDDEKYVILRMLLETVCSVEVIADNSILIIGIERLSEI